MRAHLFNSFSLSLTWALSLLTDHTVANRFIIGGGFYYTAVVKVGLQHARSPV